MRIPRIDCLILYFSSIAIHHTQTNSVRTLIRVSSTINSLSSVTKLLGAATTLVHY